jgi:hypothetical protein
MCLDQDCVDLRNLFRLKAVSSPGKLHMVYGRFLGETSDVFLCFMIALSRLLWSCFADRYKVVSMRRPCLSFCMPR